MTREDKDSIVEMLSKIPITETKGSLLSAIGKLLRVIDISENSIMIPTLLKDKCEFDAYEMLTLAKVLKASILGHNDLVEFYMSESSSSSSSSSSSASSSSPSSSPSSASSSSSMTSSLAQHQRHNTNSSKHHNSNNVHRLSATPSLRSSCSSEQSSASTSLSSPTSTPIPTLHLTATTESSSIGSSGGSSYNSNGARHHNHHHHNHQSTVRTVPLGTNGDPDATVRLLVQIEQLKTFIPQVTGIFESIIELYKNSVDTITYGGHSHHK